MCSMDGKVAALHGRNSLKLVSLAIGRNVSGACTVGDALVVCCICSVVRRASGGGGWSEGGGVIGV